MAIEIVSLHIYPVKGLRGLSIEETQLTPTGLALDRHWMIVMPNGRMVTQRQIAKLATIETHLSETELMLTANGSSISVDLTTVPEKRVPVNIWQDRFMALEENANVSAWLTSVLQAKHPLRLVRMPPNALRPQANTGDLGLNVTTQFADAAPMLITNIASLDRVNEALAENGAQPVPMSRFRPNIVVRGLGAFAEYQKSALLSAGGDYRLGLRYPSERCIVTTIDQQTGVKNPDMEPLATLLRMNTAPHEQGAYFGQNASLLAGAGSSICVGDELIVDQA